MQEDALLPRLPHRLTENEQLYFLHMAKTAGRSFEVFLKMFFTPEQTIRIDVEAGYPRDIPANVFSDYRLYLGHLGHHFLSLFPAAKKPLWITMLREPVDRVVSFYYFLRNTKPVMPGHANYRHQVMANDLTLPQFVESDETAELVENYQFHNIVDSEMLYFRAEHRDEFRNFKSHDELMTIAKRRLRDECIFFGITERYESSMALLCFTVGWNIPVEDGERLNVTPDRPKLSAIEPEVVRAIQKKVALDIELYSFACELFEKRLAAMTRYLLSRAPDGAKALNEAGDVSALNSLHGSALLYAIRFWKSLNAWRHKSGIRFGVLKRLGTWMQLGILRRTRTKTNPNEEGHSSPRAGGPSEPGAALVSNVWATQSDFGKISSQKVCFHFPASPTDAFFSQIAMFRLSLDALGGIYKRADMVVTLGSERVTPFPARWKFLLERDVIINWASPEEFLRNGFDAQGDAQWLYNHDKYDSVCFLDADVLITRPIEDLLLNIMQCPAIAGAIAHYPFPTDRGERAEKVWQDLATHLIGKRVAFGYRHTLVDSQAVENAFCPFYVNFGFILMPTEIIKAVRGTYLDLRRKVASALKCRYYSAQVALALAVEAQGIPTRAVGLRYNFPNDPIADQLHLNELRDVRLIHYLRTEIFDRHKIFANESEFRRFLSLELTGSNRIFQDHVRNLARGGYPF